MVVGVRLPSGNRVVNLFRGDLGTMIRVYTHKGIQIQQWFNKYSFRVDSGQWFEYTTLADAKKAIGELK